MRISNLLLGGLMATVVGVAFVGVAASSLVAQRAISRDAVAVEGTVVRLTGGDDGWAPVVRYATPAGDRELTGSVFSTPPSYSEGEAVRVLYRPDTGAALLDGFADRYLLPAIFGGLGSVSAVVGLVLLGLFARGRRRGRALPLPMTLAQSAEVARALGDPEQR